MPPENLNVDPNVDPSLDKDLDEDKDLDLDKDKDKEPQEKSLSDFSEEELQELLEEEEAETLRQAGLGKIKNYKQLIEHYKTLDSSDKLVFPKIKGLAAKFNMTPEQFADYLEKQAEGKPTKEPSKPAEKSKELVDMERALGRSNMNFLFFKFQRNMEKEDIEIPDELQSEIEQYVPAVLYGKSEDQIASMNPYEKAYRMYLFEASNTKDVGDLKEKVKLHEARLEKKRRQLGIPATTRSKKTTPEETQKKEIWGDLDKLKGVE